MNCEAKITDHFGGKYKCSCEATKRITIETFAPHLKRKVKKVRQLCNKHSSSLLKRHRGQIKHLGKQTELTVEELKPQYNDK